MAKPLKELLEHAETCPLAECRECEKTLAEMARRLQILDELVEQEAKVADVIEGRGRAWLRLETVRRILDGKSSMYDEPGADSALAKTILRGGSRA